MRSKDTGMVPGWFPILLAEAVDSQVGANPPSVDFDERCKNAAEAGLVWAKLKAERARVGSRALPLLSYLEGLARLAHVSLGPLLVSLGTDPKKMIDQRTARTMAEICRSLGISLDQALIHIRLQFLELSGHRVELGAVLSRSANGRGHSHTFNVMNALRCKEHELTALERSELSQCNAVIRDVYLEN